MQRTHILSNFVNFLFIKHKHQNILYGCYARHDSIKGILVVLSRSGQQMISKITIGLILYTINLILFSF